MAPPRPGNKPQPNEQQNIPQNNEPMPLFDPADEIIDGEPLKINEIGPYEPTEEKKKKKEQKLKNATFTAEKRSVKKILGDTHFAVDEEGCRYTRPAAIRAELEKKGRRLFLFDGDGNPPLAIENRSGKLFRSDAGISSMNQMPGQMFVPAGSLDAYQIAGTASPKRIRELNRKYQQNRQEFEENSKEEQAKHRELKAKLEELEKQKPVLKLKRPTKPTFSVGRRLQRWGFKIITLGFGETNAYRKFQADLKQYDKLDKEYQAAKKKYDAELVNYNEKAEPLQDALLDTEYALKQKRISLTNTEEVQKRALAGLTSPESKKKIRDYQSNLEVRLEGVADLIREGKVTRNNIFASCWMLRADCDAKDPSDPEAEEALARYLATKIVEDKLFMQISPTGESREDARLLNSLNSGSAVEELRKSQEFKSVLEDFQLEGELIDPDDAYERLQTRMMETVKESKSPVKKLQDFRSSLIESFGRKPVDEKCLIDVARLNALDQAISDAQKDPKYKFEEANKVISELYVMHGGKTRAVKMDDYLIPSVENAVRTLAEKQDGKSYGLEEMTRMVNETRNQQIRKEEPKGPQP